MLWFLIVLLITILTFFGVVKFNHSNLDLGDWDIITPIIPIIGTAINMIGLVTLIIMTMFIIEANIGADDYATSMQERREILVYQLENDVYDNDIGKRELYKQIREWNEEVIKGKEYQNNIWKGVFYPDVYDQFETIPLRVK